jgi:glycyl-tRNA synthetase
MLTFQQIIQRLTDFWGKQQCIIHQGHDLEVGAGTFNPVTFLRALGPEPYNTAYVEPSRRPKDARYGDNPNRVHLFHQFQVIMKPSPENIQELYLESLKALGLDLNKHDIRFVHDDWESPTLGAWGLGWEVWCDGMEITQFTYFQAIGSTLLHPISAEITYGLERLAMYIQNKESIFDLKWNDTLTFRDISHRSEVEWSAYNFEEASTAMWLRHFEDYEKEAKALIACHLPIPAYDFVVKASHAFNLLDARGAISVTERTGYIGRIRDLARLIAIEYTASRESLGFPLMTKTKPIKPLSPLKKAPRFNPKKRQDFLLEIGSEQLPATFVPIGSHQLEKAVRRLLEDHALSFQELKVFGTPRRLSILVKGLVEGSLDKELVRKGPAIASAFDANGHPTPQGAGFLKSIGHSSVSLASILSGKVKGLKVEAVKDTQYLFASIKEAGISTFFLLSQQLPGLILNLEFPKKMRWGSSEITYARPLHWIVALFGSKVIPFQLGSVLSNRYSWGHAQLCHEKIAIKTPHEYLSQLRKHYVLADIEERKEKILAQLKKIEKKVKGEVVERHRVIPQVLHLTEWPQLTYASFDAKFLAAPKEVLISEMVEHQRYFPIADSKHHLKNLFIITADNTPNELIRHGNQRVLSARLSDGVFLYNQDVKVPLEKFNEKLKEMTYQKELGSMYDKVTRIGAIAHLVNQHLDLADEKKVKRASLLSKADLASLLVGEFPELQGTIGKYYATAQGENHEVAESLEELWMPRQEGGALPRTPTGIVLSLSDKIDNLISCYSVGLKPSSSSDPYALRRQSIGILNMLIASKKSVDLKKIFHEACHVFPLLKKHPETAHKLVEEILAFITARAKSLFEEKGFRRDEIDAALQGVSSDPYNQFCKVEALHTFRKSGREFSKLFEVYKRAKGQLEKPAAAPFRESLATEPAEKELIQALHILNSQWKETLSKHRYLEAFRLIATLQPPLAKLFDTVKIMCDDPSLKENRIALLQKVFAPFQELLDFGKIHETH